MTESSTICIGDELFTTLADLRARGCDVLSLDTAVGGKNSQYRVSFSERVPELAPPSPSGNALTGEHCQQVDSPAALTPSIETRLQQLYEKAVQSGRVRTRFKTTTQHARLPHKDD